MKQRTIDLLFQVVRQYERAIILRNGKLYKNSAFGPGLTFYLPCVDSVKFIDLRTFVYVVPPQEVNILFCTFIFYTSIIFISFLTYYFLRH